MNNDNLWLIFLSPALSYQPRPLPSAPFFHTSGHSLSRSFSFPVFFLARARNWYPHVTSSCDPGCLTERASQPGKIQATSRNLRLGTHDVSSWMVSKIGGKSQSSSQLHIARFALRLNDYRITWHSFVCLGFCFLFILLPDLSESLDVESVN